MLDLDLLAEKRARSLKQDETQWRSSVWSPSFQKISQSMTDGEIEDLLDLCTSIAQFESVVQFLAAHSDAGSPYAALRAEAARAGVGLADWIRNRS